jgi:replicative DNA helicase
MEYFITRELYLFGKSTISAIQIYNKIKQWKLNHNIDIVYIDYLGKIRHDKRLDKLTYQIEDTMNWITASAQDNQIPIILLSQIDRQVEKQGDKTFFTLSDLKDSASIETYSHSVSFLVRPETYGITQYDDVSTKNLAILSIAKNRDGYIGKIKMRFNAETTLFEPYTNQNEINRF